MAQPVDLRELLPIPIAAALVGIHPKSLYRLTAKGRVQTFGSSGFLKVSMRQLLKPVERRRGLKKLKNTEASGAAPSAEKLA
jgi:hypothetical protein